VILGHFGYSKKATSQSVSWHTEGEHSWGGKGPAEKSGGGGGLRYLHSASCCWHRLVPTWRTRSTLGDEGSYSEATPILKAYCDSPDLARGIFVEGTSVMQMQLIAFRSIVLGVSRYKCPG